MRHYCTIPRNSWLKVNIVPARGATVAPPYVTTGLKVYIVAARGATVTPPNATTGAQRLHCSRQRRHYRTVLQVPSADDLTERVQKAVGFPCFVKPNRNSGSLGISKVQDRYTNILQ